MKSAIEEARTRMVEPTRADETPHEAYCRKVVATYDLWLLETGRTPVGTDDERFAAGLSASGRIASRRAAA